MFRVKKLKVLFHIVCSALDLQSSHHHTSHVYVHCVYCCTTDIHVLLYACVA